MGPALNHFLLYIPDPDHQINNFLREMVAHLKRMLIFTSVSCVSHQAELIFICLGLLPHVHLRLSEKVLNSLRDTSFFGP